jgi:hypothetical protein
MRKDGAGEVAEKTEIPRTGAQRHGRKKPSRRDAKAQKMEKEILEIIKKQCYNELCILSCIKSDCYLYSHSCRLKKPCRTGKLFWNR